MLIGTFFINPLICCYTDNSQKYMFDLTLICFSRILRIMLRDMIKQIKDSYHVNIMYFLFNFSHLSELFKIAHSHL